MITVGLWERPRLRRVRTFAASSTANAPSAPSSNVQPAQSGR